MTSLGAVRVARRYAMALLRTAERLNRVEEVRQDLEVLVAARRASPVMQRVLDSPLVPGPEKLRMMARALANAEELTRRFVDLLIRKRRADILPAIYEEYVRCADEAAGIARAYITSALPLTLDQEAEIAAALRRMLGRPVQTTVYVEPSTLGGVSVRVGDTVWDGSIRGTLETIREHIMAEATIIV